MCGFSFQRRKCMNSTWLRRLAILAVSPLLLLQASFAGDSCGCLKDETCVSVNGVVVCSNGKGPQCIGDCCGCGLALAICGKCYAKTPAECCGASGVALGFGFYNCIRCG